MTAEQKKINILFMLEEMMSDWSDDLTMPSTQIEDVKTELNNRLKAGIITQLQADKLYNVIYQTHLLIRNEIN